MSQCQPHSLEYNKLGCGLDSEVILPNGSWIMNRSIEVHHVTES